MSENRCERCNKQLKKCIKNRNGGIFMAKFIKLRVSGENVNLEKPFEIFKNKKISVCKKKDLFYDKYLKTTKAYVEDVWSFNEEYPDSFSDDKAIHEFLKPLLQNKDYILELSEHRTMLLLTIYPDSYHLNVAISPKTLAQLSMLKIELNIEISFLQEIYSK